MQHPKGIPLKPYRPGAPIRRPDLPPRLTVHTTETPSGTGPAVARNLQWPYHNLIDVPQRTIYNLVPWELAAYSLRGSSWTGGTETNHAGINIQMSLVTYAARTSRLSDSDLDWLANEVFAPALQWASIPNAWSRSYGPGDGYILASVNSPVRMNNREWEMFSGVAYHQLVPGQDHWDAGKIAYKQLENILNAELGLHTEKDESMQEVPGMEAPLMTGNTGEGVRRLQKLLNDYFQAGLVVDGDFGPATRAAVNEAQAKLGLVPDGIWGPLTARAFEAWRTRLADAIVAGVEPSTDGEREARKQLRQLGNKRTDAEEALTALEDKLARAFATLGLQDADDPAGLMDDLRLVKRKLGGIERDRVDALAALE